MANILFASELGGGMGHVAPFFPIAGPLLEQGHHLTLALRDLSRVRSLFGDADVSVLQAPTKTNRRKDVFQRPQSLPQILHNLGFANRDDLEGLVGGWRTILRLVRPDLVIVDHAPGALIAMRGLRIATALLGTGFVSPPVDCPMLSAESSTNDSKTDEIETDGTIAAAESSLLTNVNAVLADHNQPMLDRFGELYQQTDSCLLATFHELDHYPNRPAGHGEYVGVWPYRSEKQQAVDWPDSGGPRVFAYLKGSAGLGHLFDWVGQQDLSMITVMDGMPIDQLRQLAKPHMHFHAGPISLAEAVSQCDVVILNATHGTTCSSLLAGKPILQIPRNLEQEITARNTSKLGAGLVASKDNGPEIIWQLSEILRNPSYADSASAFAATKQDFSPRDAVSNVVEKLTSLL